MLKRSGHRNAYFPLFIPESFLRREVENEAAAILETYRSLVEDTMAIPVIAGGTSHDLGQNFSRVFGVTFLDQEGSSLPGRPAGA
jgi:hypothetical protein